jgi:predicted double-glycine peptidase
MICRILVVFVLAMAAWAEPLAVPFVVQQKNGCGAASVAMVMQYWAGQKGGAVQYPEASAVYGTLYNPELRGIPLVEMKRYLEGQGFRAYTLHGQWADLSSHVEKGHPVIVSLKKRGSGPMHFAVVTGTASDRVLLNDPTRQETTRIKRQSFEKMWRKADGWMLLAVPTE